MFWKKKTNITKIYQSSVYSIGKNLSSHCRLTREKLVCYTCIQRATVTGFILRQKHGLSSQAIIVLTAESFQFNSSSLSQGLYTGRSKWVHQCIWYIKKYSTISCGWWTPTKQKDNSWLKLHFFNLTMILASVPSDLKREALYIL